MYSYKLFVLLVLVVLLQEGNAKYKKKNYKRRSSSSSDESSSKTDAADCRGMFVCTNSTCINKSKLCDTHVDCGNGEDETNCTEPELCPRVCDYVEPKCFTQLDVPDAIKPVIFIDVNGFEITSDPVLVRCQSACYDNTACVAAIIVLDFSLFGTRTCFLSMQTFDQLDGNSEITKTQGPCNAFVENPTVYVVYDVNECIME